MNATLAFIIPSVFLFAYLLLSSIEFGAPIFLVWPKLLNNKSIIRGYINPVWETTNVFLVYFTESLFAFFPQSSFYLGVNLLSVLNTTLAIFGIRIVCMLLIFYANLENKLINFLILASNFTGPVIFSLVYIFALTGTWKDYFPSWTYLTLALLVTSTIIMVSSNFFSYRLQKSQSKSLRNLTNISVALFIISFLAFFWTITNRLPYLISNRFLTLGIFLTLFLAVVFYFWASARQKLFWKFFTACLSLATVFFGLIAAHMPYIIYPVLTVNNSLTNPAAYRLLMISMIGGFTIILPSLFLMYYLFAKAGKSKY